LIVFGKMTAPSKAAAAQLTVPAAMTQAGLLASAAAVATTKTAVVTVATVGVMSVGTITATSHLAQKPDNPAIQPRTNVTLFSSAGVTRAAREKHRYFFKNGPEGPVMIRAEFQGGALDEYLQNDLANFYRQGGTVYQTNHRMWLADLSVMRLPSDSAALSRFLSEVEGRATDMQRVSAQGDNLLVTTERHENDDQALSPRPSIAYNPNALKEDYFKSDWPAVYGFEDNRDVMHARGWTYMRIRGQVAGRNIAGTGRIPFVYGASQVQRPWLNLKISDDRILTDGEGGAVVRNAAGERIARYAKGSFFKGLGRPWMGLHAIDTVRRDAATAELPFETALSDDGSEAIVAIIQGQMKLIYTIDLEADLVRKIEFVKDNTPAGELEFEYLQELDGNLSEFKSPVRVSGRSALQKSGGIQWLVQLANGAFGQ